MAKYKFPVLNISQFYPRHGTPAAKMPRVGTAEVKRRSRELSTLFDSYTTRDNKVGREELVLVTERASDGIHLVGHNKSYDQVLVRGPDDLLGRMVRVRLTEAGKHYLKCEVTLALSLSLFLSFSLYRVCPSCSPDP